MASGIALASTRRDIAASRRLFAEYQAWLGVDLCFQGFDDELRSLPEKYGPPRGRFLLARVSGRIAGVIAVAPLEDNICEMKRLFVRPAWRGRGLGRRLAEAIIRAAQELGYQRMRLDTLARLDEAIRLYRSMGFVTIPAYYRNPLENVVYLELDLGIFSQRAGQGPKPKSLRRRGGAPPPAV
ncbi:MAG: GNAT family N-acetyltransferase [Rhodospirillales bacterium]|nr:GNAT family N-acetyltransferase [Rhodospirillales bacterium]